jgi:hypothetical protein
MKKWNEYPDTSWEFQAGKVLATMRCDGPFKKIAPSFAELYEADQFDALARKAMSTINTTPQQGGAWTIDDQVSLLATKQHDYGHANIDKFGSAGVRVRLWDKIARYENLVARKADSAHESLQDTLVDIVGYCTIYMMVRNGTFSFPLSTDVTIED